MFSLMHTDPPAAQVRHVTFVPFLPMAGASYRTALGGPGLPAGEVLVGEEGMIDMVLRGPSGAPDPVRHAAIRS